jgi:hypothetical protein
MGLFHHLYDNDNLQSKEIGDYGYLKSACQFKVRKQKSSSVIPATKRQAKHMRPFRHSRIPLCHSRAGGNPN